MERWAGVLLGIVAGAVYLIVGPNQVDTDSHWPIAQAFVAGRLHLVDAIPWVELVPRPDGGWYSPFPPLLSILLVPFAIIGLPVWTDVSAAIAGGASVALMWVLLGRLDVAQVPRVVLTIAWAFGSEVLWVAGTGGQHLAPQILAAALLLAALILGFDRRWPLLAGLLLGAAAAARLPVGLALPLLIYLYRRGGWAWVLLGIAIPAAIVGGYNLARFGDPFEFGYGLIADVDGNSVLDESWYPHGIDSIWYIPQGLYTMLLKGADWQDSVPWLLPGWGGTSVLLTMPILWWIVEARGRLALITAISAALVILPDLAHGNPGFAQVGYRFIVDALPLLWILLAITFRDGLTRAAGVALAFGSFVTIWLCSVVWLGFQE
jgi:Glycosyltransferase family 87